MRANGLLNQLYMACKEDIRITHSNFWSLRTEICLFGPQWGGQWSEYTAKCVSSEIPIISTHLLDVFACITLIEVVLDLTSSSRNALRDKSHASISHVIDVSSSGSSMKHEARWRSSRLLATHICTNKPHVTCYYLPVFIQEKHTLYKNITCLIIVLCVFSRCV